MPIRYLSLTVFLLLVIGAVTLAGSFEAGVWYQNLLKPAWNPPAWVFGPVWSVLYLMMAIAAWRVWLTGASSRTGAIVWWLLQLGFNVAWSWLFFGWHRPGVALLEMAVLIALVLMCIRAFSLLSRAAVLLMVPYLAWLLFAWLLNFTLWRMNGGGLATMIGS